MGIKRDNEVSEARNNINRFITIDKVRKKDGVRLQRSQSQTRPQDNQNHLQQSRSYNLVKEEQIRLSQERSNFPNRNNFLAKSPQPFRRGLSESRDTRFLQPQIPKQQNSEVIVSLSLSLLTLIVREIDSAPSYFKQKIIKNPCFHCDFDFS